MKLVLMTDSKGNDGPRVSYKEFIKRQLVKNFHGAFVDGKKSSDYVVSLGIPPDAVVTGLDVIDNDLFLKWVNSSRSMPCSLKKVGEIVFLTVARLVNRKGIDTLILALSKVINETEMKIRLWIVGNGALRIALEKLAMEQGLANHVTFLGARSNEEVAFYMAHSDCFVIPSEYDTWGLAANEALVARLPVIITSACGCAEELVRSGVEGIVVPPKQSEPLALAMIKIVKEPELREKFVNNGQLRIKKFSLSTWSNNALSIGKKFIDREHVNI